MNFNRVECADANTKFCPCHLADANECILCSQLCGSKLCDCTKWCGTCIFQEYLFNNSKPKNQRETFSSPILNIDFITDTLLKLTIKTTHEITLELFKCGAFIFIKGDANNNFFDFPISITDTDTINDTITFYIEIKGPKTKKLLSLKENDLIYFRAPYYNGIFGLNNLNTCKNSKVLILTRGIGIAPSYPVYKQLLNQENDITLVHDISPFESNTFSEYLNSNISIIYEPIIKEGILTNKIKTLIQSEIENGAELIHCGSSDILTYKIIEFLDSINRSDIKLSCLNNSKMCCGEGMCGSCTIRFKDDTVQRLCKVQADPRIIFKGRRFI